MSRLRRILKDDIDSFDLESLVLTAAILTLCLVGVSFIQSGQSAEVNASAYAQDPQPAR